jgi:hypothetical protein
VLDDSDGDGSCDTDDLCVGHDGAGDDDGDGFCNGCSAADPGSVACDGACGPRDDHDSPDCLGDCFGIGDTDEDGVCDDVDLCPFGPDAFDANGNGIADACDPCGNGLLDFGEDCDDGNSDAYDGCNASCVFEDDSDGDGLVDPLELLLGTDPSAVDNPGCIGGASPRDALTFAEADAVLSGRSADAAAGTSVAHLGDFNGDGHDDVAIGAPGDDANGPAAGAVQVYFGPDLLDGPELVLFGAPGQGAGLAIAGTGDLDADGRDDLVVGSDSGVAWLIYGRDVTGTYDLTAADARFTGPPGSRFGSVVAGLGDVDLDGAPDLAIGAPNDTSLPGVAGAVYLWSGVQLGNRPSATANAALYGDVAGGRAGAAIAGLDDFDGDGIADLAVGAYRDDRGGDRAGAVYVVRGGLSLFGTIDLPAVASHTFLGAPDDRLGLSVSAAGDVDGDGRDDLWIGAPWFGLDRRGAAYLVSGRAPEAQHRPVDEVAAARVEGAAAADTFGTALSGGFDADGDGHLDVVVGAPRADADAGEDVGGAWVVRGPFSGAIALDAAGSRLGDRRGARSGGAVAAIPDLDADGFGDVLIGAPRQAGLAPLSGFAAYHRGGRLEQVRSAWYADVDGDGWGNTAAVVLACEPVPGWVSEDGDCNDGNASIHPYALESDCSDPVDRNCDGRVGGGDLDGDGVAACTGDCNDRDDNVGPDAVEVCDGVDNDCSGDADGPAAVGAIPWYPDADGDGFGLEALGFVDCTPPPFLVSTATDQGGDCDDTSALVYPGAPERCDDLDNDCNGDIDEGVALGSRTSWFDADGDGYGDLERPTQACIVPPGHSLLAGDCDDAVATVSPGAEERCDGVDNDCDGGNYLGGHVALETRPRRDGTQLGDAFGEAMAFIPRSGGDLLAVGSPDADLTANNAGAVYIYDGDVVVELTALRTQGRFGAALAAGDFNGDGIGDLAVGAPQQARPRVAQGAVFLFFGPFDGPRATHRADVLLTGAGGGAEFGAALDADDLDGDGFDDLLVGSPGDDTTGVAAGAAWLYYGRSSWTGGAPAAAADAALHGDPGSALGSAVAFLGDASGDGPRDLAVGAPRATALEVGAVQIVVGAPVRFSGTMAPLAVLTGDATGARVGSDVAGAGDVDGDGIDDLLVGGVDSRAWLLSGGVWSDGDLTRRATTVVTSGGVDRPGRVVAGVPDLDGDGRAEFLVGAHRDASAGPVAGAVLLVYGSDRLPAQLDGDDLESAGLFGDDPLPRHHADLGQLHGAVLYGRPGDRAGRSLAAGGDLDGDGWPDLLVGSPLSGNGRGMVVTLLGGPYGIDVPAFGGSDDLEGTVTWWPDADGDSQGDADALPVDSCPMHMPVDWSDPAAPRVAATDDAGLATDCDDSDDSVYLGAPDVPDGVDSDCGGTDDADF